MPRSSRHKSSHKSQRRSSPVDWSASDEERELEARVSKDLESEKRKSSHSKELKESNNGHASIDHGKKRKERIESKDESAASDRWDSALGKNGDDNSLVDKRSKGDVYNSVDIEKERDKEKYLKEESKSRSSRRHDERSEEKRRYKEDKERDKEREKEKAREKEKEKEREKEKESDREREKDREKDRDRDRDRERSSRREKYEEEKREKEKYEGDRREKEIYEEDKREKERHLLEDKREKHRYEEVKREKERYDEDKREKGRHDEALSSRKRESETSRIEEGNSANKDVDIITEFDPTEREQREKHSKRRRDEISPEDKEKEKDREKDKDREREKEREKEKEKEKEKDRHRDEHSKSRSSKEHKSEPDKYKDKHRDRDRERDDRREREYYEYKSSREGIRSSESRYKKSKGSEADPYDTRDEYPSKHKDGHAGKRGYETIEDRHERDVEKEDVERSRGEYRYADKEKEKEKEKEKVDSSPGKIRLKSSPASSSYHDREQNRHRSKPIESPKKELLQEDRRSKPSILHRSKLIESPKKELMQEDRARTRTSSTGERTPSRLREEKLNRPRDDAHSLELSSEIASSTPRSDTHASPKFAPEKSPSKYSSGRGGSSSSKYRDRERDRDRERERESDVATPDKMMMLKREPTPVGTFNRSNSSSSYPPLPYEDGDNRRDNGPADRRFHKRGIHAHGNNNWNGAPNWASQVNNGFMPLPPGPPPPSGFHHFAPGPPPLFGIRPPPLKLGPSGVGIQFPMHDPMDRFPAHMRGPYGWHNSGGNNPLVDDSFPPNMWGPAGNGMFGAEPFWDQNRPLPSWKAQGGEVLPNNKEPINMSQKEIGATALDIKMEEQSINEILPSEIVDIKDESVRDASFVETSTKEDQIPAKVVTEVDKVQEPIVKVGNFWESYIPRAGISQNLVDMEMLKKCTSAIGELENLNGVFDMSQATGVIAGKEKRNGMSVIVLKSLFPTSKDENFQKAMSLYNKLQNRKKPERENAPELVESEEVPNMEVEVPVTGNIITPDLGNDDMMEVDKKVSVTSNFVSDSDSIIFKNAEECEEVMKESSEDGLSRIPITTQNTH